MKNIKCQDCSAKRSNVRYSNTRYCISCRLLRDFLYVGVEQRPCAACKRPFAPVNRKDTLCGTCNYGSIFEGHCLYCKKDAELYRENLPLCVKCVRSPRDRARIITGLRKGQAARRLANAHAS